MDDKLYRRTLFGFRLNRQELARRILNVQPLPEGAQIDYSKPTSGIIGIDHPEEDAMSQQDATISDGREG